MAAAAGAQAPIQMPARDAAVIGESMRIHGEVRSDQDMVVHGEIEGNLQLGQCLTIGPKGKVKANIKTKNLVVSGSLVGDVEAAERISIRNGASIIGDVKTAGIVIEDGAYFKGGIDIARPAGGSGQAEPQKKVHA
jgi:cytoskeletal protein CcmA (bactofilin family)